MRPTERESGAVWRLLSAWADEERSKDRLDRKITQGDMARMFGVSDRTLSTWKRCQARMPMATQLRVIKATGIALSDLTDALAEDEPRIAEWVAARREADMEELMGNAEHPAANQTPVLGPADQPGPRAVDDEYVEEAARDVPKKRPQRPGKRESD